MFRPETGLVMLLVMVTVVSLARPPLELPLHAVVLTPFGEPGKVVTLL